MATGEAEAASTVVVGAADASEEADTTVEGAAGVTGISTAVEVVDG